MDVLGANYQEPLYESIHEQAPEVVVLGTEAFKYYRSSRDLRTGFVLDPPTWKAHPHWGPDLGESDADLAAANRDAVELVAGLRDEFATGPAPIALDAVTLKV